MCKPCIFALSLFLFVFISIQNGTKSKELRLVSLDYPPYSYRSEGEVAGIAVEIVREIFREAGYQVSVDIVPWARALGSAKKGKADGIFTIYKNDEREKFLIYSSEVLMPQVVSFFKRRDGKVTFDGNISSVKNLKLSIVNRVSYGKELDSAIEKGVFSLTKKNNTLESSLLMLQSQRVDLVPSNRLVAYHKIASIPELKDLVEVKPPITDIPSYIAFTRQRDMTAARDTFDAGIRRMKKEGQYDEIIRAHVGSAIK